VAAKGKYQVDSYLYIYRPTARRPSKSTHVLTDASNANIGLHTKYELQIANAKIVSNYNNAVRVSAAKNNLADLNVSK